MYRFKYRKKCIIFTAIVFTVLALCTGCSNERKESQAEIREKGILLMEQGEYEQALELFQDTLDLSLGEIGAVERDICYYQAEAQYKLGDTQAALDTYTALINFDGDAKAYFLRGNLYYKLNNEENALKDYAAAIEKDKNSYELYIGVYEALTVHGKDKEAQEYLNQALEIKGDKAYDKMQKGRINHLLGEDENALKLLQEAASGNEMLAYYYLAEIQYELGNNTEAMEHLSAYVKSDAANSYNLFSIANNHIAKKNYDIAIECLNAALELEKVPNKQIIMKNLVMLYEELGDFVSAKEVLEAYVKEYPDDEEAKRELTFLNTRLPEEGTGGN